MNIESRVGSEGCRSAFRRERMFQHLLCNFRCDRSSRGELDCSPVAFFQLSGIGRLLCFQVPVCVASFISLRWPRCGSTRRARGRGSIEEDYDMPPSLFNSPLFGKHAYSNTKQKLAHSLTAQTLRLHIRWMLIDACWHGRHDNVTYDIVDVNPLGHTRST